MSIELPNARTTYSPKPPDSIRDPEINAYLRRLATHVDTLNSKLFDNDNVIRSAINTGTSGTFAISGSATLVISDGIIISVS